MKNKIQVLLALCLIMGLAFSACTDGEVQVGPDADNVCVSEKDCADGELTEVQGTVCVCAFDQYFWDNGQCVKRCRPGTYTKETTDNDKKKQIVKCTACAADCGSCKSNQDLKDGTPAHCTSCDPEKKPFLSMFDGSFGARAPTCVDQCSATEFEFSFEPNRKGQFKVCERLSKTKFEALSARDKILYGQCTKEEDYPKVIEVAFDKAAAAFSTNPATAQDSLAGEFGVALQETNMCRPPREANDTSDETATEMAEDQAPLTKSKPKALSLEQMKICIPCKKIHADCIQCGATPFGRFKCTKCAGNKILKGQTCVAAGTALTGTGTFIVANRVVKCTRGCSTCTGIPTKADGKCTTCDADQGFKKSQTNHCVEQCIIPSQYYDGSSCKLSAVNGCMEAKGSNKCLKCMPTAPYLKKGSGNNADVCAAQCDAGYFGNDKKVCYKCHADCASCIGPSPNDCTKCSGSTKSLFSEQLLNDGFNKQNMALNTGAGAPTEEQNKEKEGTATTSLPIFNAVMCPKPPGMCMTTCPAIKGLLTYTKTVQNSKECHSAPVGAATINAQGVVQTCIRGKFWMDSSVTPAKCMPNRIANCTEIKPTENKCDICMGRKFVDAMGKCMDLDKVRVPKGKYIKKETVAANARGVLSAATAKYVIADCHADCAECIKTATMCTVCSASGKIPNLKKNASPVCVAKGSCPTGTWENDRSCDPCGREAATCAVDRAVKGGVKHLTCNANYFLDPKVSKCVKKCKSGLYPHTGTKTCKVCDVTKFKQCSDNKCRTSLDCIPLSGAKRFCTATGDCAVASNSITCKVGSFKVGDKCEDCFKGCMECDGKGPRKCKKTGGTTPSDLTTHAPYCKKGFIRYDANDASRVNTNFECSDVPKRGFAIFNGFGVKVIATKAWDRRTNALVAKASCPAGHGFFSKGLFNTCVRCAQPCSKCMDDNPAMCAASATCIGGTFKETRGNSFKCVRKCSPTMWPDASTANNKVCAASTVTNCGQAGMAANKCRICKFDPKDATKQFYLKMGGGNNADTCETKAACMTAKFSPMRKPSKAGGHRCVPCNAKCDTCGEDPTWCTKCKTTDKLVPQIGMCVPPAKCNGESGLVVATNSSNCAPCTNNYFRCASTTGTANPDDDVCDTSCNGCFGQPGRCIECAAGFLRDGEKCVQKCMGNSVKIGQSCRRCDKGCKKCIEMNGRATCMKCEFQGNQPTFLSEGQCLEENDADWPVNAYANKLTGWAMECGCNCAKCKGGPNQCTECPPGLTLNKHTKRCEITTTKVISWPDYKNGMFTVTFSDEITLRNVEKEKKASAGKNSQKVCRTGEEGSDFDKDWSKMPMTVKAKYQAIINKCIMKLDGNGTAYKDALAGIFSNIKMRDPNAAAADRGTDVVSTAELKAQAGTRFANEKIDPVKVLVEAVMRRGILPVDACPLFGNIAEDKKIPAKDRAGSLSTTEMNKQDPKPDQKQLKKKFKGDCKLFFDRETLRTQIGEDTECILKPEKIGGKKTQLIVKYKKKMRLMAGTVFLKMRRTLYIKNEDFPIDNVLKITVPARPDPVLMDQEEQTKATPCGGAKIDLSESEGLYEDCNAAVEDMKNTGGTAVTNATLTTSLDTELTSQAGKQSFSLSPKAIKEAQAAGVTEVAINVKCGDIGKTIKKQIADKTDVEVLSTEGDDLNVQENKRQSVKPQVKYENCGSGKAKKPAITCKFKKVVGGVETAIADDEFTKNCQIPDSLTAGDKAKVVTTIVADGVTKTLNQNINIEERPQKINFPLGGSINSAKDLTVNITNAITDRSEDSLENESAKSFVGQTGAKPNVKPTGNATESTDQKKKTKPTTKAPPKASTSLEITCSSADGGPCKDKNNADVPDSAFQITDSTIKIPMDTLKAGVDVDIELKVKGKDKSQSQKVRVSPQTGDALQLTGEVGDTTVETQNPKGKISMSVGLSSENLQNPADSGRKTSKLACTYELFDEDGEDILQDLVGQQTATISGTGGILEPNALNEGSYEFKAMCTDSETGKTGKFSKTISTSSEDSTDAVTIECDSTETDEHKSVKCRAKTSSDDSKLVDITIGTRSDSGECQPLERKTINTGDTAEIEINLQAPEDASGEKQICTQMSKEGERVIEAETTLKINRVDTVSSDQSEQVLACMEKEGCHTDKGMKARAKGKMTAEQKNRTEAVDTATQEEFGKMSQEGKRQKIKEVSESFDNKIQDDKVTTPREMFDMVKNISDVVHPNGLGKKIKDTTGKIQDSSNMTLKEIGQKLDSDASESNEAFSPITEEETTSILGALSSAKVKADMNLNDQTKPQSERDEWDTVSQTISQAMKSTLTARSTTLAPGQQAKYELESGSCTIMNNDASSESAGKRPKISNEDLSGTARKEKAAQNKNGTIPAAKLAKAKEFAANGGDVSADDFGIADTFGDPTKTDAENEAEFQKAIPTSAGEKSQKPAPPTTDSITKPTNPSNGVGQNSTSTLATGTSEFQPPPTDKMKNLPNDTTSVVHIQITEKGCGQDYSGTKTTDTSTGADKKKTTDANAVKTSDPPNTKMTCDPEAVRTDNKYIAKTKAVSTPSSDVNQVQRMTTADTTAAGIDQTTPVCQEQNTTANDGASSKCVTYDSSSGKLTQEGSYRIGSKCCSGFSTSFTIATQEAVNTQDTWQTKYVGSYRLHLDYFLFIYLALAFIFQVIFFTVGSIQGKKRSNLTAVEVLDSDSTKKHEVSDSTKMGALKKDDEQSSNIDLKEEGHSLSGPQKKIPCCKAFLFLSLFNWRVTQPFVTNDARISRFGRAAVNVITLYMVWLFNGILLDFADLSLGLQYLVGMIVCFPIARITNLIFELLLRKHKYWLLTIPTYIIGFMVWATLIYGNNHLMDHMENDEFYKWSGMAMLMMGLEFIIWPMLTGLPQLIIALSLSKSPDSMVGKRRLLATLVSEPYLRRVQENKFMCCK